MDKQSALGKCNATTTKRMTTHGAIMALSSIPETPTVRSPEKRFCVSFDPQLVQLLCFFLAGDTRVLHKEKKKNG